MKNMEFRHKLTVKLLYLILISLFVTIAVMIVFSRLLFYFYSMYSSADFSAFEGGLMFVLWISTAILTFILIFILLVSKKIKYLKSISHTVQHIADGKLGLTIEIKGKDELTQLAHNINYMSKELENKFMHERELELNKNELITNVSHDLRTPLTSIIGYLDLIKNGHYDNESQFQEYFETIYSKSQRLKNLIDELFEFTRLSSSDAVLNLSQVDLAGLLHQIVGEYIPIFEKEQLSIRKSITVEDMPVLIDIEKMVHVYENLFMNAIKYSIKPSDIQISLVSEGDFAVLRVSNKVDLPPGEDVNKLFERFFRGDKSRMNVQGTGLGLSISKRIVELHNGDIRAEYKNGWIILSVEHFLQSKDV